MRARSSGDPGPASKNSVQVTAAYFQKKTPRQSGPQHCRSLTKPNLNPGALCMVQQDLQRLTVALPLQVIPCTGDGKGKKTSAAPSLSTAQRSTQTRGPLQSCANALPALPVPPPRPCLPSQCYQQVSSTEALCKRGCVSKKRQLQLCHLQDDGLKSFLRVRGMGDSG